MIRTALYMLLAFTALSTPSCLPRESQSHKMVISVSILPQKYFIEKLVGEEVEVNVLIPPGASPATYEPTMAQLTRLDQSDVYMRIGYIGFELSWMDRILSVNPELKVIDLSNEVQLVHEESIHGETPTDHKHGGIDPHIWMSVINSKIIAANIYRELILLLPDEKESLKIRYEKFQTELDSLHQQISHALENLPQRSFLIYHPALTYFARDYSLHQYPLELEGKTPSPAYLKEIIDLGREKNISTIFIQSQFDRRNAEVLAEEIDATIVQFDPLDEEWDKQMLYIARQFNGSL